MTTERGLRLGEALLALIVLALGLFITVETFSLPASSAQVVVGPKLFPSIVGTGLIVVGGLLVYEAFAGHVAHEGGGFELDWKATGLVLAALIVQMLLLERLGWIIATTLLFAAVARAFGSRRPLLDIAIGLALTSLAFVAFTWGLGLTLPGGVIADHLFPTPQ
jgi:putative tricarboxylic transport membrane protein